ncbi:MAG: FeoB-associated Cys-rich membrane protein [Butyricicoccaceae bacterium]
MSPADIIIVAVLAVLFVLAVRYILRHPSSCGGNCAGCTKRCRRTERDRSD